MDERLDKALLADEAKPLPRDLAELAGLVTADAWADWSYRAVPYTGEWTDAELSKALYEQRSAFGGWSSANTEYVGRFEHMAWNGKRGFAVTRTRIPLGD